MKLGTCEYCGEQSVDGTCTKVMSHVFDRVSTPGDWRAPIDSIIEAEFRREVEAAEPEKRGFAGAIAPDKPYLVAGRDICRCALEQRPPFDGKSYVVYPEHRRAHNRASKTREECTERLSKRPVPC